MSEEKIHKGSDGEILRKWRDRVGSDTDSRKKGRHAESEGKRRGKGVQTTVKHQQ